MKKIILILICTVFAFSCFSQQETLTPKPLKGFYIKFPLTGQQFIWTKNVILYPKTLPTTWYFGWIDTIATINIARLNWDQVAKFTYSVQLYYDYYEYWNWFNPFELYVSPHFTTNWVDIMDGDGYTLENSTAFQIAEGVAAKFNIDISQIQVINYY
jgi:hypothetical protein